MTDREQLERVESLFDHLAKMNKIEQLSSFIKLAIDIKFHLHRERVMGQYGREPGPIA